MYWYRQGGHAMNHNEIKKRLLKAESAEEAAAIALENGIELSAEGAENLFREIQMRRKAESESNRLDPRELDTVTGGTNRSEYCKATVEADELIYKNGELDTILTSSWCWFGTDYCDYATETYKDTGITFGHLYPDN